MNLGACIDQNGNAYIGQSNNVEWLEFDMPPKYKRVFNEHGGTIVTPEDIAHEFVNHTPKGNALYFDCEETQEYFNDFEYR